MREAFENNKYLEWLMMPIGMFLYMITFCFVLIFIFISYIVINMSIFINKAYNKHKRRRDG